MKIIAQLLPALPTGEDYGYRVIFMERDLGEVVASQRDMIAAKGTNGAKLSDVALQAVFPRQLRTIGRLLAARRSWAVRSTSEPWPPSWSRPCAPTVQRTCPGPRGDRTQLTDGVYSNGEQWGQTLISDRKCAKC